MRIFLTGFMGSGKSTLGRKLAKAIGFEFIDLDIYIEKKNQYKIPRIFEKYGEQAFRELEQKALHEMFRYNFIVVATGGGTPCFFDNMEQMNMHGETLYLKIAPESLAERLITSKVNRPLLSGKSPDEAIHYIRQTLEKREPYYAQCKHVITDNNLQLAKLQAEVETWIKNSVVQ